MLQKCFHILLLFFVGKETSLRGTYHFLQPLLVLVLGGTGTDSRSHCGRHGLHCPDRPPHLPDHGPPEAERRGPLPACQAGAHLTPPPAGQHAQNPARGAAHLVVGPQPATTPPPRLRATSHYRFSSLGGGGFSWPAHSFGE